MVAGLRYGVDVRAPAPADAGDLARLLPPATPRQVADRLEALARDPQAAALVATGYDGAVIGLAALGWGATLLADRPVARLAALVVAEDERRRGIGRLLLKAASQLARSAGCEAMEAAAGSGVAFWEATGFADAGVVYVRSLRRK